MQLAVPASEILLVQQDGKNEGGTQLGMCESPVLVATDSGETLGWLGNNVLVLMSQPQEYVMVEQEVVLDSAPQQSWQVDGSELFEDSMVQFDVFNTLSYSTEVCSENFALKYCIEN